MKTSYIIKADLIFTKLLATQLKEILKDLENEKRADKRKDLIFAINTLIEIAEELGANSLVVPE